MPKSPDKRISELEKELDQTQRELLRTAVILEFWQGLVKKWRLAGLLRVTRMDIKEQYVGGDKEVWNEVGLQVKDGELKMIDFSKVINRYGQTLGAADPDSTAFPELEQAQVGLKSALDLGVPLSIEQAAEYLQIHPKTLQRQIKPLKIPAHRVGNQWRFYRAELDDWIRTKKEDPPTSGKEHRGGPSD